MTEAPRVEVRSRDELRDWLSEHHAAASSVWLVSFRKPSPDHLPWPEIVRELICWGWVDSLPRKLDEARTMLRISPRDPKSAWSGVNKRHAEAARAEGRMTRAGEAAIEAAKAGGWWTFLDDVERLEVPDDLAGALRSARGDGTGVRARTARGDGTGVRARTARDGWEAYPDSVKRGTLEWIKSARTAPTRARRVAEVARAAAAGERPAPFARKERRRGAGRGLPEPGPSPTREVHARRPPGATFGRWGSRDAPRNACRRLGLGPLHAGGAGGPDGRDIMSDDRKDDAPTAAQLRDDIDHGEAGDKVGFPDPSAAPLGTDAEAGGNAATREELKIARKAESGRGPGRERDVEDRPVSVRPDRS